MQILTLENKTFLLDNLPEEVDEECRFAVLDNSDSKEPDFFFMPLIFLESFNAPAMVWIAFKNARSGTSIASGFMPCP